MELNLNLAGDVCGMAVFGFLLLIGSLRRPRRNAILMSFALSGLVVFYAMFVVDMSARYSRTLGTGLAFVGVVVVAVGMRAAQNRNKLRNQAPALAVTLYYAASQLGREAYPQAGIDLVHLFDPDYRGVFALRTVRYLRALARTGSSGEVLSAILTEITNKDKWSIDLIDFLSGMRLSELGKEE